MGDVRYLQFEGLDHPVALEDAAGLLPLLTEVLGRWPHRELEAPSCPPFLTIRPSTTKGWSLALAETPEDVRHWDGVNLICDLVAEMAWERIRSDPELLCLHAAAVEFGGRLVVFPNVRRAGKSTLTVALARLGHAVFTDDFLPVRFDAVSAGFLGLANGVPPRVRLPVPESFSAEFQEWVRLDEGPSNRQYKYLTGSPVAPGGAALPVASMVVLDRQEEPCAPSLEPLPRDDALAGLIEQNFARARHAGTILALTTGLAESLPVFRLAYHSAEEAAAFLSGHEALRDLPVTAVGAGLEELPPGRPLRSAEPFEAAGQYVQAAGVAERGVGDDHFLADGSGQGIHRLNPVSGAIWRVLAEPVAVEEIVDVLADVFEEVPRDQLRGDVEGLLRSLAGAGLIERV